MNVEVNIKVEVNKSPPPVDGGGASRDGDAGHMGHAGLTLSDLLRCPVCEQVYELQGYHQKADAPRVPKLFPPCQHSICGACLIQRVAAAAGTQPPGLLTCPTCGITVTPVTPPSDGIGALPNHFMLILLQDRVRAATARLVTAHGPPGHTTPTTPPPPPPPPFDGTLLSSADARCPGLNLSVARNEKGISLKWCRTDGKNNGGEEPDISNYDIYICELPAGGAATTGSSTATTGSSTATTGSSTATTGSSTATTDSSTATTGSSTATTGSSTVTLSSNGVTTGSSTVTTGSSTVTTGSSTVTTGSTTVTTGSSTVTTGSSTVTTGSSTVTTSSSAATRSGISVSRGERVGELGRVSSDAGSSSMPPAAAAAAGGGGGGGVSKKAAVSAGGRGVVAWSSPWKVAGQLQSLPLPMGCTLATIAHRQYYFSIRARDRQDRPGPMAQPKYIDYRN